MAKIQEKAAGRRTGNPAGAVAATEEGQQKQPARQASAPEERKLAAGGTNPNFLQETLF